MPATPPADGNTTTDPPEILEVPEDVTGLEADALDTLRTSVEAELDRLREQATTSPETVTAEDAARALELADAFQRLDGETTRRIEEQQGRVNDVLSTVSGVLPTGSDTEPADGEENGAGEGADGDEPAATPAPEGDPAPADGAPADAMPVAASAGPVRVPAAPRPRTINPALTLGQIQDQAPDPGVANRRGAELVITAASDIPDIRGGTRLNTLADLVEAVNKRAMSMGITSSGNHPGYPVASIRQTYAHVLDETSSIAEAEAAFRALLQEQHGDVLTFGGMSALVAAGGWCAPSEIDYSFFDVTGPPAGLVDLPTVGIRRGGLRWPESLDLAQFFAMSGAPASGTATNATMPWLWTEADDILAVTGSPTKLCLRPPCPDFDEERLWLLGACILAGNLTAEAYPEAIRHFMSLVQVAHARVMNRRTIALMVADGTVQAVTPTKGTASSAITHFLGAAELVATSERARLGMPQNAVMELLLPFWVRGLLRSDISKRNGWDDLSVADAWFMQQLDARNIRVQWLEDWQSNTGWNGGATIGADTNPVAWPSSFVGLMYPPGHFFQGNGMTLTLGVIRDSVLNETNDYTALWTEEARLVGRRGNRALAITFSDMWPNGYTGAQATQVAVSA